jgi:hypothetical protein
VRKSGRGSVRSDIPVLSWKNKYTETSVKIASDMGEEFHTKRVLQDKEKTKYILLLFLYC